MGGAPKPGLRSRRWELSYKTSSTLIDGRPLDILHDFFVPALSLATRYDRVAGYFSSSSLAAASQGYSAFVNHGGKMRLIVGADLSPKDVQAILDGDEERLALRLNSTLEHPETWPQSVSDGVTLLSWMVARGFLEIRVAFRVHRETGVPVPYEFMGDGYVHEKWFLLADDHGDRMYGTGSLNESETALVHNAENIDVHCEWGGGNDQDRVNQAVLRFEEFWNGVNPHMAVLTLPEAVRQRLVSFSKHQPNLTEIDGTTAARSPATFPSTLELLRFAVIRDAPKMPGGKYVGIDTAPVEPWPHQAIVARRLVDTWPYSYLLCDEVGLGKTIEAGLAFRSLHLSGAAKRILVAAPPSLGPQWQREMAQKLLMRFALLQSSPQMGHHYLIPNAEFQNATNPLEPDLLIMSTGLLARDEWAKRLLQADGFDIALVDEAHAARRQNSTKGVVAWPSYGKFYLNVRDALRRQTKSLWLATATPMQLHTVEACDLVALTKRVGAFGSDPSLILQYFAIFGTILNGNEPNSDEWEFMRRALKAAKPQDPQLWRFLESGMTHGLRQIMSEWLDYRRRPTGRDLELARRLIFALSPVSRVMMRHTRALLEIYRDHGKLRGRLPKRNVLPAEVIAFDEHEARVYAALEDYCKQLEKRIKTDKTREVTRFYLSFLRLRFASSIFAIRETLRRRLERVRLTLAQSTATEDPLDDSVGFEDQAYESEHDDTSLSKETLKNRSEADLRWEERRLQEMLADLPDQASMSSKMRVFLSRLDDRSIPGTPRIKQTVVFSRFVDTLTDIQQRLRLAKPGVRVGTYTGQKAAFYDPIARNMCETTREKVKELFIRGEIDVLLCTDAAAEGLNLQTADLIINYDLGWNPMKIEQRIGRIDRIGQKHDHICVLNFCYAGSEEEAVYVRLLDRLANINLVVGPQQMSLLPVERDEFMQLASRELSEQELERRVTERIRAADERSRTMQMSPKDTYEMYEQMAEAGPKTEPSVDLDSVWQSLIESEHLRRLGCELLDKYGPTLFGVNGVQGIQDGALITASRETYDRGAEGVSAQIHFASYGDDLFDKIVSYFNSYELPSCIRRISVGSKTAPDTELVAYAVACITESGGVTANLVTSLKDLDDLSVAEDYRLTEDDIEQARAQLLRSETTVTEYKQSVQTERANEFAAAAQEALNLASAKSLFTDRSRFGEADGSYMSVLREVESLIRERQSITAYNIPVEPFRYATNDLLFEVRLPRASDSFNIKVSSVLGHTVLDTLRREIDAMRSGPRKGITKRQVVRRLENRFNEKRKRLRPSL